MLNLPVQIFSVNLVLANYLTGCRLRLGLEKSRYQVNIFLISPRKMYVVGTHKKWLAEALLMSTHNKCFHGEIRNKYQFFWIEKNHLIQSYGF